MSQGAGTRGWIAESGGAGGGAGVSDHGALTGLLDDDHPQYLLLAGRAGGQTAVGGTGAGDALTLGPGNATGAVTFDLSAGNANIVNLNQVASLTASQILMRFGQAGTVGAAGRLQGIRFDPNLTFSGLVNANVIQLFQFTPTVTLDPAVATSNINAPSAFLHVPTYALGSSVLAYGNVQNAGAPSRALVDTPSFTAATAGATAAMNAGHDTSHQKIVTIDTGWSFPAGAPVVHAHTYAIQAGAGTVNEHVGHDIEDLKTFAGLTTGISVRSKGALVTMRHQGAVILGAVTAPGLNLILDSIGKAYVPHGRTMESDHTQPADTSWTVAVSFEVASGVTYELSADAILDVT